MRKLLFILATMAISFTGCNSDTSGNEIYEKLLLVRPGTYIYDAAAFQNEMSMQPADVAIRLAILRAETVKQTGSTAGMNDVKIDKYGNLKTFLFGTQSIVAERSNGVYEITYVGQNISATSPDAFIRKGTFSIQTQGIALEETDETNTWIATQTSDKVTIKNGNQTVTNLKDASSKTIIYRDGTSYAIHVENYIAYYVSEQWKSLWSGRFTWIPSKTTDLSYETLKGTSFTLDGQGRGTTFASANNRTAARMSYSIANGEYNPARSGSYRMLIGGTSRAEFTDSNDYNVADYPSPSVIYKWNVVDNTLKITISYNNNTVTI